MIKIRIKVFALLGLILLLSLAFADAADTKNTLEKNAEELNKEVKERYEFLKLSLQDSDACGVSQGYIFPLVFPALLIGFLMILISAIVQMTGNVLNSDKIKQMAREEYYQSGLSIILAFLVLISIIGSNAAFSAVTGTSGLAIFSYNTPAIIDKAMDVTYEVTDQIASDLAAMMFFNGMLTFFAASSITLGSFHSSIHISPGLALKPLTDVVTLVVQVLSVSLSEWIFHIFSLCLIKKWAISVFLPLGMLLRAIPHTRDGGNAIISLMLVLYIVYPVMFISIGAIYHATYPDLHLHELSMDILSNYGFETGLIAFMIGFLAKSFLIPVLAFATVDTVFLFIKESLYMFFIMSLILPFIAIMVSLTATKELGKQFFGVDINLSAIIRVI